jgi:hypothetical protein
MKGMHCESGMVTKTQMKMEAMNGKGKAMNFVRVVLRRKNKNDQRERRSLQEIL